MLVWLIWLFIIVLALFDCLRQHLWLRREGSDLFGYQLFLGVNFSSFARSSCFQRHLLLRRVGGCLVVFCCNWLPLVVFFVNLYGSGCMVVWLFIVVIGCFRCLWLFFC